MSRPIYGLTIRALLGQRRTLALVLLSLAPVFMALVFSLAADADADPHDFYSRLVQRLFIPVITALVALIVGVSAIGDEREDGTILYLAATPLPRLGIVVAKILAAWTVCVALLVPSAHRQHHLGGRRDQEPVVARKVYTTRRSSHKFQFSAHVGFRW